MTDTKEKPKRDINKMKDQTPSTNHFMLWVPLFLLFAWFGRNELPERISLTVHKYEVSETVGYKNPSGQFDRYANGDPMCGGETLCILGWRL